MPFAWGGRATDDDTPGVMSRSSACAQPVAPNANSTPNRTRDRRDGASGLCSAQVDQLESALQDVGVRILLEDHWKRVVADVVGQVAVQVQLGADGHARADQGAHPAQDLGLAVVMGLGDHGPVQVQVDAIEAALGQRRLHLAHKGEGRDDEALDARIGIPAGLHVCHLCAAFGLLPGAVAILFVAMTILSARYKS